MNTESNYTRRNNKHQEGENDTVEDRNAFNLSVVFENDVYEVDDSKRCYLKG